MDSLVETQRQMENLKYWTDVSSLFSLPWDESNAISPQFMVLPKGLYVTPTCIHTVTEKCFLMKCDF